MQTDTGISKPVSQRPYPIAMKHYDGVKNKINKLLDTKAICSSHSSWSALIIIIYKGDGGKHLIIDYRTLSKVTQKFSWPMPKVKDIFSKLNSAQYFCILNLWARYHHILLNNVLIPKTVFTSPFGKYKYLKVPFRLTKASALFQKLRKRVLKDLFSVIAYLNNIIIYSKTAKEHLGHLQQVFHKLCNAKLSMKLS